MMKDAKEAKVRVIDWIDRNIDTYIILSRTEAEQREGTRSVSAFLRLAPFREGIQVSLSITRTHILDTVLMQW